ncbi:hypothetical protein [Maribacter dokdonensis]|uniref:hypothetical protein n=1 Tax=Maribacter dokdonensis TaxID=320912 RepID=UPI002733C6E5|nr:hypothetical protein [Maribacter dokdonensis]MDP2526474.1 hypothetical protein [Maribacter dokdonensis]
MKIRKTQDWLKDNHYKLCSSIEQTECYKWSRWLKDQRTHVFPCVCTIRNSACSFAETYHAIWKVNNILVKEDKFIEALIDYFLVIEAKSSLKPWLKRYKQLFQEVLLIDDNIKVCHGRSTLQNDIFKFTKEELKHLLKFEEVYLSAI